MSPSQATVHARTTIDHLQEPTIYGLASGILSFADHMEFHLSFADHMEIQHQKRNLWCWNLQTLQLCLVGLFNNGLLSVMKRTFLLKKNDIVKEVHFLDACIRLSQELTVAVMAVDWKCGFGVGFSMQWLSYALDFDVGLGFRLIAYLSDDELLSKHEKHPNVHQLFLLAVNCCGEFSFLGNPFFRLLMHRLYSVQDHHISSILNSMDEFDVSMYVKLSNYARGFVQGDFQDEMFWILEQFQKRHRTYEASVSSCVRQCPCLLTPLLTIVLSYVFLC